MGMDQIKVLFLCGRNTARSQMAEGFLRHLGGDFFDVKSAGLEAGEQILPMAIEVMAEVGIDISCQKPKRVFDLFLAGRRFHYVIAVCDAAKADRCPVFPGVRQQIHWPFPDPADALGSDEEKRLFVRSVRDRIHHAVEDFIRSTRPSCGSVQK